MEVPRRIDSIDVPFAVPQVHRLRFTQDVFGQDRQVLADLLEPSGTGPARVQFWMDHELAESSPGLPARIRSFVANFRGRLTSLGNIQYVPGGEAIKNDVHILEQMLKVMHAADLDRRSYLVVIGGGAVLDAVGFAAAIAHRGIRLVRLPTTTLSQADSGIGVKNAVNLFGKKNWIGTFATPWGVVNDETLLASLSDRDFICGFSEAVKVALLKDGKMFGKLCEEAPRIAARDRSAALPLIRQAAIWHLRHITQGGDPFEANEARPLDFGHWSAHKLEAMSGFELRHGEAVAIGLAIDAIYSSLVHGLPKEDARRVVRCLIQLGFQLDSPVLEDSGTLLGGLEEFRQHLGGRLTVTMLRGVGDPIDVHRVDRRKMLEAVRRVASQAGNEAYSPGSRQILDGDVS